MKKNAFTLIELIAVIVILGLIIGIATTSYLSINKSVRESHRQSLIREIEIVAEQYATDTGITNVFVDTLVKEGYLSPTDNSGNVTDPTNNKNLNCYIVRISEDIDNYDYDAKFEDKDYFDEYSGTCDTNSLESNSDIIIKVKDSSGGKIEEPLKWFKSENITLEATKSTSSTIEINCDNNNCYWDNTNGYRNTENNNETISINGINVLNTTFNFTYTASDTASDGKTYKASKIVKVDNEEPTITKVSFEKDCSIENCTNNNLIIEANDGNGSGIKGYALIDSGSDCISSSNLNYEKKNLEITKNGNYKVCVSDNVGNIKEYNDTINIDNLKRKITYNLNDGELVNSDNLTLDSSSRMYYSWYTEGSNISLLGKNSVKKTGYTLSDWKDENNNEYDLGKEIQINKNYTFSAEWSPKTYTVTFNANGGTVSPSENTVTYGKKYDSLPTPTKENYNFLGWYTSVEEGIEVKESTTVSIANNHTLYAHWEQKICTVNFDAGEGLLSSGLKKLSVTIPCGNYFVDYYDIPDATKTGKALVGWYDDDDRELDGYTMINDDNITYYANYAKTYIVEVYYGTKKLILSENVISGEQTSVYYYQGKPCSTTNCVGYFYANCTENTDYAFESRNFLIENVSQDTTCYIHYCALSPADTWRNNDPCR